MLAALVPSMIHDRRIMPNARVRILRHVLIALAVLLGQQATQLHAFSHQAPDLSRGAGGDKGAPPSGHAAAQCLAFHAMDSVLPSVAPALELHHVPPAAPGSFALPLAFPPRIVFDSRAPPVFS